MARSSTLPSTTCPEGHADITMYEGGMANPHKLGTLFCHACGRRYPTNAEVTPEGPAGSDEPAND